MGDLRTDDIIDTKDADKGQVVSFNVLDILFFRIIVIVTTSLSIEVAVGKSNRPESEFGVGFNDCLDLGYGVVIKGNNLGLFVHVVLAAFEDHFRGALDHKPLSIGVFGVGIADDSRHSFSA